MIKLLALLSILASYQAIADCSIKRSKSYGDVVVSSLVGVYEGDTFTVTIDGWQTIIGEAISVRLAGAETPEIRGKCPAEKVLARKARAFTQNALIGAKVIELRNLRRDKYYRLLCAC